LVFKYGGCPPCWICDIRDWTTHEEYLVVFIITQSLIAIDEGILIIGFEYFAILT